jgi:hypothetical protein
VNDRGGASCGVVDARLRRWRLFTAEPPNDVVNDSVESLSESVEPF